jgi:AAA ATPase domain
MKLKSLHIDTYRHLENISFDFTYPEGHSKAGNPLEKICIIGQSATGKTSILESIKDSFSKLNDTETLEDQYIFKYYQLNFKGYLEFLTKDGSLKMADAKITKNGKDYTNLSSGVGGAIGKLMEEGLKLLYLSSEIISKDSINIFNLNPLNIVTDSLFLEKTIFLRELNKNYIYEFAEKVNENIWFSLLSKILDYRKRFNQMASELFNKGAIGDANKIHKEYKKWADLNENPLVAFASYFNPILEKLHLEVDLVNTEYSIPISSKIHDEVIPVSSLSTGTKGLLLSMFPLYEIDTTDAIILLDEPERSLFPDMQIDLISHYQNLAPDAQFVVATHSPFIAAAFEPEERFILYFAENGKVAVRRGTSPIGDDPNDILRNDFNVDYYNNFGKKAYQSYLDLKRKIAQETKAEKKKELIVELAELGDKYNF